LTKDFGEGHSLQALANLTEVISEFAQKNGYSDETLEAFLNDLPKNKPLRDRLVESLTMNLVGVKTEINRKAEPPTEAMESAQKDVFALKGMIKYVSDMD